MLGETFVNHLFFDWRLEKNYADKMGCKDEHMSNSPYADNLKFIYKDNLNELIIAHLNINSMRNKLDFLVDKIKGNIEITSVYGGRGEGRLKKIEISSFKKYRVLKKAFFTRKVLKKSFVKFSKILIPQNCTKKYICKILTT